MKQIKLRDGANHKARAVLKSVASQSPTKVIDIDEMRRRVAILDAIDKAKGDVLVIEDAEYNTLKAALQSFPWAVAHPELLAIIDDVGAAISISAQKAAAK